MAIHELVIHLMQSIVDPILIYLFKLVRELGMLIAFFLIVELYYYELRFGLSYMTHFS